MTSTMMREPFYRSGFGGASECGVFGGWVAHENSFSDGQPFSNERGDVCLLLSGECFTSATVPLNAGSTYLGRNGQDLVRQYEKRGLDFISELNGQFSGLLMDKRERKAFLFNDRYGFERIYWHETSDAFFFASEAKALLRVLPNLREFDPEGVAQFLAFGCTLNWRTLFRDVRLLPNGSLWTFTDAAPRKQYYFESATWEKLPALPAELFESQFEETFQRVLPRYVEPASSLGISLTGGLDTRMVMAWRPKTTPKPVCYTYSGLSGETYDDRVAAKVASVCGLNHTVLRLSPAFLSEFATYADNTVYITDGSSGVTGAHELYFSKQARKLAPIRLTGLFGSEILRGFSTFKPSGLPASLFNPDFYPAVAATIEDELGTRNHSTSAAAFRNVPWNLLGSAVAGRSQLVLRTPYLDNDVVELAFQTPEALRSSPQTALRMIDKGNARLAAIPTDRGLGGGSGALVTAFRRFVLQSTFKVDYLYNEGMPARLLPFDAMLGRLNSHVKLFGFHKFLHYRRWFRNELSSYLMETLDKPEMQLDEFLDPAFRRTLASEHIAGRQNAVGAINAVLTLDAVARLLFRGLPRAKSDAGFPLEVSVSSRTLG